jgi:pyrroline-5-carboxylate reductase
MVQEGDIMEKSLGFIGAGHITEMLLTKIVASGIVNSDSVFVSDANPERLVWIGDKFGVRTGKSNREVFEKSDITLICVQPQIAPLVVKDLEGAAVEGKVLLTIAAGVPMEAYESIGEGLAVIRALPNPPSQVGCAIIPYAMNRHVTAEQRVSALEVLDLLGKCIPMNEDGISVVTSLSSPAAVFLFLDTMVEAGVLCGLNRKDAVTVAHQTVHGCLRLWESKEGKTFGDLIADASTPGGVSVETLYVLDRSAFRGALKEAYLKGADKARGVNVKKDR